ncbi:aspartate/glutamate racemase family protein [Jannaschia marina]|uniref:hypothetical protein n=1 Tax=Jannaschia marina TaxID=2741674 RepID=UPI0015CB8490|nr:hypothetical protein [Jannaschia marina]
MTALTVLQLDTAFPRIPGDVTCAETYVEPPEILRVPRATVGQVVTDRPEQVDIAPFERAMDAAKGDVIATSCGFLAPWQSHLAARTDRPFTASALCALPDLLRRHAAGEILVVTFDAARLTNAHLGGAAVDVIGLPDDDHLRRVIANDLPDLDQARAGADLVALVRGRQTARHRHILLECTNLPPYKAAIRTATDLPVTDILSLIEGLRPGTVTPAFL